MKYETRRKHMSKEPYEPITAEFRISRRDSLPQTHPHNTPKTKLTRPESSDLICRRPSGGERQAPTIHTQHRRREVINTTAVTHASEYPHTHRTGTTARNPLRRLRRQPSTDHPPVEQERGAHHRPQGPRCHRQTLLRGRAELPRRREGSMVPGRLPFPTSHPGQPDAQSVRGQYALRLRPEKDSKPHADGRPGTPSPRDAVGASLSRFRARRTTESGRPNGRADNSLQQDAP